MPDRLRWFVAPTLASLALGWAAAAHAGAFSNANADVASAGTAGTAVAHPTGAASQSANVAGLAFLDRGELSLGGTGLTGFTDFSGANPYPGEGIEEKLSRTPRLTPVAAYAQPLSSKLVIGLGVDVPFDFKTAWDSPDSFSGRFLAQNASLRCYSLGPSIAWKLADRLAVGAGLDVNVAMLEATRRLPAINPFTLRRVDGGTLHFKSDRTMALGYRFGLLARVTESLAVGLAYRDGASFDFAGTGTVERIPTGAAQLDNKLAAEYPPGAMPFALDVKLPPRLTGGVAYTWSGWTLSGELGLERWSSFGALAIPFADAPGLTTTFATDYSDTHPFRVGIERRVNHALTLRGGYARDSTPLPVQALSPVLFDADRQTLALGASATGGTWRIDLSSGVRLYAKRATEGTNPEGFDGTYKSVVPVLGVSFARRF